MNCLLLVTSCVSFNLGLYKKLKILNWQELRERKKFLKMFNFLWNSI